jgi:hypothetical protein
MSQDKSEISRTRVVTMKDEPTIVELRAKGENLHKTMANNKMLKEDI